MTTPTESVVWKALAEALLDSLRCADAVLTERNARIAELEAKIASQPAPAAGNDVAKVGLRVLECLGCEDMERRLTHSMRDAERALSARREAEKKRDEALDMLKHAPRPIARVDLDQIEALTKERDAALAGCASMRKYIQQIHDRIDRWVLQSAVMRNREDMSVTMSDVADVATRVDSVLSASEDVEEEWALARDALRVLGIPINPVTGEAEERAKKIKAVFDAAVKYHDKWDIAAVDGGVAHGAMVMAIRDAKPPEPPADANTDAD